MINKQKPTLPKNLQQNLGVLMLFLKHQSEQKQPVRAQRKSEIGVSLIITPGNVCVHTNIKWKPCYFYSILSSLENVIPAHAWCDHVFQSALSVRNVPFCFNVIFSPHQNGPKAASFLLRHAPLTEPIICDWGCWAPEQWDRQLGPEERDRSGYI